MNIRSWILLVLLVPACALAQPESRHSKNSYLVKLRLVDGQERSGVWMTCNDSTFTLSDLHAKSRITVFDPKEIYSLEIRKLNSVKRNAIIGAGIGLIIGFVIGWEQYQPEPPTVPPAAIGPDESQFGHAVGGGVLGAFIGGFVGYLTGLNTKSFPIFGSLDQYQKIKPELMKYNLPAVD